MDMELNCLRKCGISLRVLLVWSTVVTSVGVLFVLWIIPHWCNPATSLDLPAGEPPPFFHLATPSSTPKTLVSYAYFEKSREYRDRLSFFLATAALPSSNVDYVFIVQGSSTVIFPDQQSNIHVLHRDNTCFDFGAHGKGLQYMRERLQFQGDFAHMYDYYIFLNPSAIGPFLPSFWPADRSWTSVFTSQITEHVKLVGPSLVCLPLEDLGGYGPKIEGYAFATDSVGLSLLWRSNNFKCFVDKIDVVVNGEYKMSNTILASGFNIASFLLAHKNIDWRDKSQWNCNKNKHPTRYRQYGLDDHSAISVHPLEALFHKTLFVGDEGPQGKERVFENESNLYRIWALRAKRRQAVL